MGYSTTKIPFMVLDDSKIQVQSASKLEYFYLDTLNDFANFRGGFEETDKEDGTMFSVFSNPEHKQIPDFVEFVIL